MSCVKPLWGPEVLCMVTRSSIGREQNPLALLLCEPCSLLSLSPRASVIRLFQLLSPMAYLCKWGHCLPVRVWGHSCSIHPYQPPHKDSAADTTLFQCHLWIFANITEPELEPCVASTALPWRLSPPPQMKMSGQFCKQEWRPCYVPQEGRTPKKEKWHSLIIWSCCDSTIFLHLIKGRCKGCSEGRKKGVKEIGREWGNR